MIHWRDEAEAAWELFRITLEEWNMDNATRLSAALAYYTIFAIAPLLLIGTAVAGIFLGREAVQAQLMRQVGIYLNDRTTAEFLQTLLKNWGTHNPNLFATVIAFIALLYGATGVFSELKSSLNLIWDVPIKPLTGVRDFLVDRVLALIVVMISGLLLLISLIVSTFIVAIQGWLTNYGTVLSSLSPTINFWFFFLITLFSFALIYKFLPDVRIAWRDVWIGALATALLFSIGRFLISLYLTYSTIESSYGAAGSLVALLLWIYYSAEIFFLGAEFTQVYGRTKGSRRREQVILAESIEKVEAERSETTNEAQPQTAAVTPALRPAITPKTSSATPANFVEPVVEIVTAVGVIGVLSVINLVFQPFRKQKR